MGRSGGVMFGTSGIGMEGCILYTGTIGWWWGGGKWVRGWWDEVWSICKGCEVWFIEKVIG